MAFDLEAPEFERRDDRGGFLASELLAQRFTSKSLALYRANQPL